VERRHHAGPPLTARRVGDRALVSDGLPAARVLAAFGVDGPARPLPGGQGESARAGDLVLKPARDLAEAEGVGDALEGVEEQGFRLGRPVRAIDGSWVVDGWAATRFVAGAWTPAGRWPEIVAACRSFTGALAGRRRPDFLAGRTHRWAFADAVAWGEADLDPLEPVAPLLARLRALRGPVDAPSQLVHGDLAGNLLLADGLPPAVIDVSPYWRPAVYAEAVLAVDGLVWDGAPAELALGETPGFAQAFVRALIFRLVDQEQAARADGPQRLRDLDAFADLTDVAERLLSR
jgi:uncharacterized protein (TIGR02569 family)